MWRTEFSAKLNSVKESKRQMAKDIACTLFILQSSAHTVGRRPTPVGNMLSKQRAGSVAQVEYNISLGIWRRQVRLILILPVKKPCQTPLMNSSVAFDPDTTIS
jgi:hypothetical protein